MNRKMAAIMITFGVLAVYGVLTSRDAAAQEPVREPTWTENIDACLDNAREGFDDCIDESEHDHTEFWSLIHKARCVVKLTLDSAACIPVGTLNTVR